MKIVVYLIVFHSKSKDFLIFKKLQARGEAKNKKRIFNGSKSNIIEPFSSWSLQNSTEKHMEIAVHVTQPFRINKIIRQLLDINVS